MIELNEMFNTCTDPNSYIRVNAELLNDIYVGFNQEMMKSIVIIGKSKQKLVKSTKSINANISSRSDGRVSLKFSLIENRYSSVFYKFCEDIIQNSEMISQAKVISHSLSRWKVWKALFVNSSGSIMGDKKIMGLIGELMFLKNHMINSYNMADSISSWMGPHGNPKDFQIDDKWFEIKAVKESKQSVIISSFEQLDSKLGGYLVIIKLQNTSKESVAKLNLNLLVTDIAVNIKENEVFENFMEKLKNVGYEFNEEYENHCFEYKSTVYYKVDSDFPVIRRNMVPKQVLKISYELSFVNINEERIAKWI